ncbi:DUF4214 domain-containing protein [Pseudomonas sp. SLFW]|uniref:beta strand repeat-containing protein n=1 Tax=Pseudomonas sp. SLFW TaxID=2683259 RepID=UPI001413004C|nr:DUF4214 domain-containing protein [Pseudomonas sp. SLFW]NBB13547.1 DUF4214 domain-containing protein [Pseudomonas sp. SLFW]
MSTQSDLAELYTAFFNRAPDSAGLAYWVNQLNAGTISLNQIAKNWVESQPEGQAKYPAGMTTTDFVNAIYGNVLSRTSDTDGLAYWKAQLDAGTISRDTFVATVINGAKSNTSTQGKADAALLSNKATVGIAFADKGLNDTTLAAKVLTSVNADSNSLNATLDLIKLVPSSAAGQTTAVLNSLSTALGNVANLIKISPAELGNLVTYLNAVLTGVTSNTNLDTLFTSINTKVVAAQTNPSALADAANQGANDASTATPSAGGGGTPPVTAPTFTVTNGTGPDAGKFTVGTANGDVKITIENDKVVFKPTTGSSVSVDFASITKGLVIDGTATVSVSDLSTLVSAPVIDFTLLVNTLVAPVVHQIWGNGTIALTGSLSISAGLLNTLDINVTPKLNVSAFTGISGSQADLLTALSSNDITGLGNKPVLITDSVSLAQIAAVDAKTTGLVSYNEVTDLLENLTKPASAALIQGHDVEVSNVTSITVAQISELKALAGPDQVVSFPQASIIDSIENLKADVALAHPVTEGHDYSVNDSLAHVIADKADGQSPLQYNTYSLTDSTVALGVDLSVQDAQADLFNAQSVVSGASNADDLQTLNVTYTLKDDIETLLEAAANTSLLAGHDVTVSDGASIAKITSLKSAEDVGAVTYTVTDSLQNVVADKAGSESVVAGATSYALADTEIDLGENLSVTDAVAELSNAQSVIDGASNKASLDSLSASYTLEDTLEQLQGADVDLLAGHNVAITGSEGQTVAQINSVKAAAGSGTVSYLAVSDTVVNLKADMASSSPLTVAHTYYIHDSLENVIANIASTDPVPAAYVLTGTDIDLGVDLAVSGLTSQLSNAQSVINGARNADDLGDLEATYSVKDTAQHLLGATPALLSGHNVTISDSAASIATIQTVKTAAGTGDVTYGVVTDTVSDLKSDIASTHSIAAAHTYTVNDSLANVAADKADIASALTYQNYSLTNTVIDLGLGLTVAAASNDLASAQSVIDHASNHADLDALEATYSLSDTAANLLDADEGLLVGHSINIADGASIAQIKGVVNIQGVGEVTHGAVVDIAVNLTGPDAHVILTGSENITVSDSASVSQLDTINALTSGIVTGNDISDIAANLFSSEGVLTSYVGKDSSVTVGGNVTIAELKALVAKTEDATKVHYTSISDTLDNLSAEGAAAYIKNGIDVTVTDESATIAKLSAIDEATGGKLHYDGAIDDTAEALATDAALNSGAGKYTAGKVVTVSDAATLLQLATINDAANDVLYTKVSDTALNLALNTGLFINSGTHVTVQDAATISQLTTIEGYTEEALTYTKITDNAAQLLADSGHFVKDSVTVTVSDTGSVAASTLNTIDSETTTQVDASSVTAVTGNFADVSTAFAATGIKLSGSETLSITDTAANLAGKTLAATTSTSDVLNVGLASVTTDLSHLTGFETINLEGSNRFTNKITIGDGEDVSVHAQAAATVVLGQGHQSFYSSVGNDTVTVNAGSTFVFAGTAAANGTDLITNFTTGSTGSALDFSSFIGLGAQKGYQIVNDTSDFGGEANSVTLLDGTSGHLAAKGAVSVADFTNGTLSTVNGKEVIVAFDNTAHSANVYFVNSAGGGSASVVDNAADITLVGTLSYTGSITSVNDLHLSSHVLPL